MTQQDSDSDYTNEAAARVAQSLRGHRDLVFIEARDPLDVKALDALIAEYGAIEAQKYHNHLHLLADAEDLAVQRIWAWRLLDAFRERAKRLFPDQVLLGQLYDDGCEVEVTFWVDRRPHV